MLLGAAGDALMALNVVAVVLANRSGLTAGQIQAGEDFTITGAQLVPAILIALATPLVPSSVWAFRRLSDRPPTSPRRTTASVAEGSDGDSSQTGHGPLLRESVVILR